MTQLDSAHLLITASVVKGAQPSASREVTHNAIIRRHVVCAAHQRASACHSPCYGHPEALSSVHPSILSPASLAQAVLACTKGHPSFEVSTSSMAASK